MEVDFGKWQWRGKKTFCAKIHNSNVFRMSGIFFPPNFHLTNRFQHQFLTQYEMSKLFTMVDNSFMRFGWTFSALKILHSGGEMSRVGHFIVLWLKFCKNFKKSKNSWNIFKNIENISGISWKHFIHVNALPTLVTNEKTKENIKGICSN